MSQAVDAIEDQVTLPLRAPDATTQNRQLMVSSYGLTHVGGVRNRNEDQFLIAELTKALRVRQSSLPQPNTRYSVESGHLFIVADGMGGREGGDTASALAVASVEEFVLNTLKWFFHLRSEEEQSVLAEFQLALQRADATILAEAFHHPHLMGMGTTLTIAYSSLSQLFIVHVGGNRCYLQRSGHLYRLTHDQTVVGEMLRHHVLTPEQAARHELRHVVTSCVGGNEPGVQVEAHRVTLAPGDKMLLCSDGLTEMLTDDQICAALNTEREPKAACERLVAEANARISKDNVTVIVSCFDDPC
jgi:protein phosphatase